MADEITWPLLVNVIRGKKQSNTFGMVRTYANGTPKPHQGWDFAAKVGTTAYAIADGVVEFVESGGDYGNRVCMRFQHQGKVYYAFYAHLQLVFKQKGDAVALNDELGATGKSGNASNLPAAEDHLHFELRLKPHPGPGLGDRLSPVKIFKKCPLTSPIPG